MNAQEIEEALFRPRSRGWTAAAFLVIVLVGLVDYDTGPEITFSVFYLIPVAAAAWMAGTRVAIAASALAAVAWFAAEYLSSRVDPNMVVYTWNFCARLLFLLLVALLLARLREMFVRERNLSRTDPLTGLLNARAFRETAEAELARARRYRQPLSLVFIDVDNFKNVNDSHGHGAGDTLLKAIGEVIRANLRASDVVARYGGDEFVALLPVADREAAQAAMDKLGTRMGTAVQGNHRPVTLSIGVVTWVPDSPPVSIDRMLEAADRLMYEVKSSGKCGARYAEYPA